MWYDFKQGKSAAESHRTISEVFGDEALSESQCRRWFQRFKKGNESLEDEEHGSRPHVVDNKVLKDVINTDPHQTTRELAVRFNCSNSTIHEHLLAIGKTNRCGKWVPHQLSDANKATRVAMAGILLRRCKNSGFFNSVVTSDEMYLEVLDSGQTVTADIYKDQLSRVDQALRRQGVETTSTKFLHDNARPHVAKTTLEKIDELGWEVLPHPPYSPDLAPSDYHLFRSMQHSLAERKFKNREEVQLWVSNYFDSQPTEFFRRGIYSLRTRWQQVIDSNGEYLLD
uniref:HTH_48 domain-containing protein n=1 Tax=Haemonchus contortus TaxID=6289 RepID=A0A7I5EEK2_HAECO